MSVKKHDRLRHGPYGYTSVSDSVINNITSKYAYEFMVWVYLLSKPEGWEINEHQIRKQLDIGEQKLKQIFSFFYKTGLLILHPVRGEKGEFLYYDREIMPGYDFAERIKNIQNKRYENSEDLAHLLNNNYTEETKTLVESNIAPSRRDSLLEAKPPRGEATPLYKDSINTNTENNKNTCAIGADALSGFEEFKKIYPRRKDIKKAEKPWSKLTDEQKALVLADIPTRILHDDDWQIAKFIPYPASYLNAQGWLNEMTPLKVVEQKLTYAQHVPQQQSNRYANLGQQTEEFLQKQASVKVYHDPNFSPIEFINKRVAEQRSK